MAPSPLGGASPFAVFDYSLLTTHKAMVSLGTQPRAAYTASYSPWISTFHRVCCAATRNQKVPGVAPQLSTTPG